MIRKILRPSSNNFTISIPNEYVNQEVEFIMFLLERDELVKEKKQQDHKSLRGIFNQYADNSKLHLEDKAWQNHIVDKYKI
jgi:FtsZ-binding cell division protein ZapB